MAEIDFERRLERLFAEPPSFSDDAAFAERVGRRLDRGWRLRRLLIGVAGLAGGVIGASQLIVANVVERVESVSQGSGEMVQSLERITPPMQILQAIPAGSTGIWVASGFAVLFMGFVLTRVIEEI
jgi:hypothetical protein